MGDKDFRVEVIGHATLRVQSGGKTLLTFHELYPSREALEEAMTGSAAGLPEQMDQLEELLSGKA